MLSEAYTMFTLVHGAPSGAGSASCRPLPELAQRTNDAASGV
jgi:hypothetical protein